MKCKQIDMTYEIPQCVHEVERFSEKFDSVLHAQNIGWQFFVFITDTLFRCVRLGLVWFDSGSVQNRNVNGNGNDTGIANGTVIQSTIEARVVINIYYHSIQFNSIHSDVIRYVTDCDIDSHYLNASNKYDFYYGSFDWISSENETRAQRKSN